MGILRWPGTALLAGLIACGGGAASAPDGSVPAPDGAAADDAFPSIDAAEEAEARGGDSGATDATDFMTNADAPSDARSLDAACATGSVQLVVRTAPGSSTGFCVDHSFPVFSPAWYAIDPADGGLPLLTGDPCPGVSVCGECSCNGGGGKAFLGDAGEHDTWDGTYYVSGTGSCGRCAPCGLCATPACAPPGDYVARFCGYATAPDASTCGSTPTCTEAHFAWPPQDGGATVLGLLGP
jgi:hypothetical protein